MDITKNTQLTTQAIMFTDGEDGQFTQHHKLFADDVDTDVLLVITGDREGSSRVFITEKGEHTSYEGALVSAGHSLEEK